MKDDYPICTCQGSGEGMREGTICSSCKGKGEERPADDRDRDYYTEMKDARSEGRG